MAKVRIKTPEGDILVRLYDDTPRHRDNFLNWPVRATTTARSSTVSSRTS